MLSGSNWKPQLILRNAFSSNLTCTISTYSDPNAQPSCTNWNFLNKRYSYSWSFWVFKTYFFKKTPGIFRLVTLSMETLEKTKLHPWKFCKNATPLGNSKVKNQHPSINQSINQSTETYISLPQIVQSCLLTYLQLFIFCTG